MDTVFSFVCPCPIEILHANDLPWRYTAQSDDSKNVKNLDERQGEGDGEEEFKAHFLLVPILEVKHFYLMYKG